MNADIMSMLPESIRKEWAEQEKKNAELCEKVRLSCADALECLATAIKYPRISRLDLEEAQKHVMKALSIASVLDPE